MNLQSAEIVKLLKAANVSLTDPTAIKTYIKNNATTIMADVKVETDKIATQSVDTSNYKTPTAANLTVSSVSAINDINASFGTEVNNLSLPDKITLNLSDGTTAIVDATWSSTGFFGTKTASYRFTAIYTLPEGVTGNMPEAKLNVAI
ncbi:hypothetical protein KPL44_21220 [Clostridium sp. DSM 17811]|uniref:hypothetical protein n=1 Tax=Clostridium sp. DSM 17811 TaxID=2843317 RepID=UPI001C0BB4A6|nr:hypothetical protein [Clostridium sp. DSM 17811]MBU3101775.1 hypothetical protein [Clostridium sp. DSM 17811]